MKFRVRVVAILVAACALVACRGDETRHATAATIVIDDFGDSVRSPASPPQRVVSLNPTTTELMFTLGAGARLVGRTHWDLFPDSARLVADLGDGIRPNVERVMAARPDLVVLYAAEDNRAAAKALRAAGIATLSLKVDRIADFRRAVTSLSHSLGSDARGTEIADSVARSLARVRATTAPLPAPSVFWPLWEHPLMATGGGSFLSELIETAGGKNVFRDMAQPSPEVSFEEVLRRDPDVILSGPETARRITSDPVWRKLRAVRDRHVLVIDTSLVMRPSVRLGEAALSLARLLHPEIR